MTTHSNFSGLPRYAGRSLLWLALLLAMVPIVFLVITSLKPEGVTRTVPPTWLFDPTIENYSSVLSTGAGSSVTFGRLLFNSAAVSIGAVILTIAVAVPAAYALTLKEFRRSKGVSSWILSTYMFPPIVAVIPLFIIAGNIGAIDTYPVLIIPYAAFNLPIARWILRSSLESIPIEVQEAALVDGANRRQIVWHILTPLLMPAVATAGIISLIVSWNESLLPLSLTRAAAKTSPVGVQEFTGLYGTQWGNLTAASCMIAAPIVVCVLVLRRRVVAGLAFGAVNKPPTRELRVHRLLSQTPTKGHAMAAVQDVNASRSFEGNQIPAVNQLDLDIAHGEFMVLVGPSGSGKSTALRMMAGLEDVDEGEIRIGGQDVSQKPPKDRDIAMVFQNYALYPHMTVAENMGFALKLQRVSKDERNAKVRRAAELLDLGAYLDRKPKALAGGQRQRGARGRAICRERSVFLRDEPLSNLDAKLRVETRANIAALQARLGTTTVYVTHDQVEAMTMGDRVAVLKAGVLQQVDGPRNLYDRPANAFVAEFIGSPAMNLRSAALTETGADFGGLQ